MYLVFDVGGTYVKYACMTGEGEFLEKGKTPTPLGDDKTPYDLIAVMEGIYREKNINGEIEGIAVDLPGRIDVEKGYVHVGGGLRYMLDFSFGPELSKACDNLPVALENDAKSAALAEVWLGNAKDVNNAIVLVYGTGIGGGIIIDRKVHHGSQMMAGELSFFLSHLTRERLASYKSIDKFTDVIESYRQGCPISASYMSTASLVCRAADMKGMKYEDVNGELVYRWAREGDPEIIALLEDIYFESAVTIVSLCATLNPDIVLIGGGISAEPAFVEGIRRYVNKIARLSVMYGDIRVEACKFRNDSNMLGALYNFKQKYGLV